MNIWTCLLLAPQKVHLISTYQVNGITFYKIMNKRIAIIDLGTNTCNLLIAEYYSIDYHILYQGKEVVKLGKNGIGNNHLTEDELERAILAIAKHQERIRPFSPSEIMVTATSAIRDAINKEWFAHEIKASTGLDLQIISGEKEAELIFTSK